MSASSMIGGGIIADMSAWCPTIEIVPEQFGNDRLRLACLSDGLDAYWVEIFDNTEGRACKTALTKDEARRLFNWLGARLHGA